MANLIAVTFDDTKTAFDLRAALAELQSEYLIEMEDIVVVTREENDKVKLHQPVNLTAAGAAVFVLVRKATADKVLDRLQAFRGKGKVLQTSLTKDSEEELRALLEG